ncbi:hypothetical protein BJY14_003731 [Actinomadura luteofluorescens]|uniref:Uncharacterized protein n=1 Tax=Actinomadura luteofluorescens TaxID=46163 RepID=A0A7Y9EHA4_9ACTN|nr:hypothetical protein [Actinomadura luteofluorescens]NYD47748.1 hypothetical protein [Actinomadura luteofluorescens]
MERGTGVVVRLFFAGRFVVRFAGFFATVERWAFLDALGLPFGTFLLVGDAKAGDDGAGAGAARSATGVESAGASEEPETP